MAAHLPGFTAEASLYKSSRVYYAKANGAAFTNDVVPQFPGQQFARQQQGGGGWGWDCAFLCAICRYYPGWCFPCWLCLIWDDVFSNGTVGVDTGTITRSQMPT